VNSLIEWYPRSCASAEAIADAVGALVFEGLRQ
jgi:hypothetical protein